LTAGALGGEIGAKASRFLERGLMERLLIYDTTLRDGAQTEGIWFSLEDKIAIALKLDELGIDYIEGGFPGSNPKDAEFFKAIRSRTLRHARIAAFGMTRRSGSKAASDPGIKALIESGAPVITIVGKSWDLHVREVLKTSRAENITMISETIKFLKSKKKTVFFDAEHFFDGYIGNPTFALETLKAAEAAGADQIILCDTNGGRLPEEIAKITKIALASVSVPVGIHAHNDSDLAVANTIAAVEAGALQVQGTLNGYGERCGNARLSSVMAVLALKMKRKFAAAENLRKLTEISRFVDEVANLNPEGTKAFVGPSAFAHKGGMHVDAVRKNPRTYEHIKPEVVGNERRILVSELSGASNVLAKTLKYNIAHDRTTMRKIVNEVARLENEGYQFEAAEASFDLLVRKILGRHKRFFNLKGFRVMVEKDREGNPVTEATIKVEVEGKEEHTAAEGDGPVNALDNALRKALEKFYPSLRDVHLVDYKVRIVNPRAGTAAKVRVVIQSRDREEFWATVGVSENIIEASWLALVDSVEFKLLKDEERGSG